MVRFLMPKMCSKKHGLLAVQQRIAAVQSTQKVRLLAVSKGFGADAIQAVIDSGQSHFAENYLQEALAKIQALKNQRLIWHFIGPVQSNKTAKIAQNFAWVHSVERLKIARRLNAQRPKKMGKLNVLLQVNIDNEPTKSGVLIDDINSIVASVKSLENLVLRGFMCIPNPENTQQSFAKMAQLFDAFSDFDTLSMGMSADFELAIKYGATFVRVGSDIFGKRI